MRFQPTTPHRLHDGNLSVAGSPFQGPLCGPLVLALLRKNYVDWRGILGMVTVSTKHSESLAKWTPTAFLAAGVLFLLGLGLTVQEMSSIANTLSPFVAVAAFIATFIGLFGLYTWLAETDSRLPLAGLLLAALALLSVLVLLVYVVGSNLLLGTPLQGEGVPAGINILFLLTPVSAGLSFLVYGVASLLTSTPSQVVGVLMMVPVLAWPGYVVVEQVLGVVDLNPIAVFVVVAVTLLVIGYLLRTEATRTEHTAPSTAS